MGVSSGFCLSSLLAHASTQVLELGEQLFRKALYYEAVLAFEAALAQDPGKPKTRRRLPWHESDALVCRTPMAEAGASSQRPGS